MLPARCLLNRSIPRSRGLLQPARPTHSASASVHARQSQSDAAITALWTRSPVLRPPPPEPATNRVEHGEEGGSTTPPAHDAIAPHDGALFTRSYGAFDVRTALLRARPHLPFDTLRDPAAPLGERLRMIDSARNDSATRLLLLECLLDACLRDPAAAVEVLEPAHAAGIARALDPNSTAVDSWRASLRAYHALLARLRRLAVEPPADWLAQGLLLSARARDAASLRDFATRLGGTYPVEQLQLHKAHADLLSSTVGALRLWIRSDVGLLHTRADSRRAAQLCAVLTATDGARPHAARLFAGLLDGTLLVPEIGDWARSLRDLGGVRAVTAAWRLRPEVRPWERRAADNDESYQARCNVLKSVVDVLAEGQGMPVAWEIVNSWGVGSHAFDTRTIRRLVRATPIGLAADHPLFESWQEALGTAAITLLEEAERCLQVRWTGGENGWHVLLEEEEPVEAVELITKGLNKKTRKETTSRGSKECLKGQPSRHKRFLDPVTRQAKTSRARLGPGSRSGSRGHFTPNF